MPEGQFTALLRTSLRGVDGDDDEVAAAGSSGTEIVLRSVGNGLFCRVRGRDGALVCDRKRPGRSSILDAGNQGGWQSAGGGGSPAGRPAHRLHPAPPCNNAARHEHVNGAAGALSQLVCQLFSQSVNALCVALLQAG